MNAWINGLKYVSSLEIYNLERKLEKLCIKINLNNTMSREAKTVSFYLEVFVHALNYVVLNKYSVWNNLLDHME